MDDPPDDPDNPLDDPPDDPDNPLDDPDDPWMTRTSGDPKIYIRAKAAPFGMQPPSGSDLSGVK